MKAPCVVSEMYKDWHVMRMGTYGLDQESVFMYWINRNPKLKGSKKLQQATSLSFLSMT